MHLILFLVELPTPTSMTNVEMHPRAYVSTKSILPKNTFTLNMPNSSMAGIASRQYCLWRKITKKMKTTWSPNSNGIILLNHISNVPSSRNAKSPKPIKIAMVFTSSRRHLLRLAIVPHTTKATTKHGSIVPVYQKRLRLTGKSVAVRTTFIP